MAFPVHYPFNRGSLCGRSGPKTDHCPDVTCGFCKKELSIRGWYKEFKIHLEVDGQLACQCTTYARAKKRGNLTADLQKVTCQSCLKKKGLGRRPNRWGLIGSDDALLGLCLVTE